MNTASIRKGKVVYWIVGILHKERMIKDIVPKRANINCISGNILI